MKYRVTAWTEVAVDVIVEADSEDEAKDLVDDSLVTESYIDGTVGIESDDDNVVIDEVDLCDSFRIDECEEVK